jgi:antitoxin ParD1/3/4
MQTMNISLPSTLKGFVDGQSAEGSYSSTSEYVRELIRADEQRKARQALEAALLDGLSSAESVLSGDDWKAIRAEDMTRLAAHPQAS